MGSAVCGMSLRNTVSSSKSSHDKEYKDGNDQNQREIRYLITMTGIYEQSQPKRNMET
jgi:hypothetical protein